MAAYLLIFFRLFSFFGFSRINFVRGEKGTVWVFVVVV
jgi:hypothetical protein